MALYRNPDTEQAIATHSMIRTFRRCPKQAEFKYALRLKPKVLSKPLRRGTWMHKLLEVHYKGEDWREEHQRLSVQFNELFDEERDVLGDLPRECAKVMRSYLWHYKDDPWKVHEVEFILETEFPDGTLFRCKIDLLIENQFGLWIVDHKTHRSLPNLDYRLLDAQSADYVWCALRNKIPVQGHIWNYIRWKPATKPQLLKSGTRLSSRSIETDYPTFYTALKEYSLPLSQYAQQLRMLKGMRFRPGEMQTSPFFRRDFMEKSPGMLRRVASEAYHTARRMNEYDFSRSDFVERVIDRSCSWGCSYTDLCAAQLMGGNLKPLLKRYTVGDPLDYYNDDSTEEKHGDGS